MESGLDRATTEQLECGSDWSCHDYKGYRHQYAEWDKCKKCGIRGWHIDLQGREQRRNWKSVIVKANDETMVIRVEQRNKIEQVMAIMANRMTTT